VKAFVKTGNQPGEASVEDVPFVGPGAGEVSLRVASCGICGCERGRNPNA
jgi:threonine dehydrogenase-like Zn-dependent dehydrogenase